MSEKPVGSVEELLHWIASEAWGDPYSENRTGLLHDRLRAFERQKLRDGFVAGAMAADRYDDPADQREAAEREAKRRWPGVGGIQDATSPYDPGAVAKGLKRLRSR